MSFNIMDCQFFFLPYKGVQGEFMVALLLKSFCILLRVTVGALVHHVTIETMTMCNGLNMAENEVLRTLKSQ